MPAKSPSPKQSQSPKQQAQQAKSPVKSPIAKDALPLCPVEKGFKPAIWRVTSRQMWSKPSKNEQHEWVALTPARSGLRR